MRMSCNGCRVLRKGCSEDCSLRPCLQWIKSPESQANATVFLAKFYGRAGLINLLNAGAPHLRPAIFRSLLYEACGRIVNPTYGSVGLMWSGKWQRCQEAVEAVLKGSPFMQLPAAEEETTDGQPIMPLKGCDIRHLSKDPNNIHRVRTRNRFKRSSAQMKNQEYPSSLAELINEPTKFSITGWDFEQAEETKRAPSHDSLSVETVETTLVSSGEPVMAVKSEVEPIHEYEYDDEEDEVALDLTLGFNPMLRSHKSTVVDLSDDSDS